MDTSEQNIEMCRKAKKIQEQWKHLPGDLVKPKHGPPYHVIDIRCKGNETFKVVKWAAGKFTTNDTIHDVIWLPRQDQLQDMLGEVQSFLYKLNNFRMFMDWNFVVDINSKTLTPPKLPKYHYHFSTMEQCWLAFIMKEKYNKVWNGTDWVVAE